MSETVQVPSLHDPKREIIALDMIRLAALWVAAGALYKLFSGAPQDLPPMVQEFKQLSIENTFRGAIAVELCVVTLAFFRPRAAWILLVGMFAVFGYVLWPLVQGGAESCGCFGSSVTIPPLYMMLIDGVFAVGILATQPWSAIPKKPFYPLLMLPVLGLSIWAPFGSGIIRISEVTAPPRPQVVQTGGASEEEETGQEAPAAEEVQEESGATEPQAGDPGEPGEAAGLAGGGEEVVSYGWRLPDPLPSFHVFEIEEWQDQMLFDLDLYAFVDVEQIPDTCHVVFYRQTCEHCAEHLEELALDPPAVPLVLVKLPDKKDSEANKVTHVLPPSDAEFDLPVLDRGYMMQTPVVMDVEGYMVTRVQSLKDE